MKTTKEIIEEINQKSDGRSFRKELRTNHPEIYTEILNSQVSTQFIINAYSLINNITEIPKCKQCGKKEVKFYCFKTGFREFCSVSCQATFTHTQIPLSVQKYNKENNTKLTNVSQLPEVIEKRNKTMIDKFGTIMPMNEHKETVKKKEATSMKRYGVKNAAQAPSTRLKAQTTMKNKSQIEKDKTQTKYKKTFQEKYGVDNPNQVTEFHEKSQSYRWKDYVMPSGKIVKVQGYENSAIDLLLKNGYTETQIIIDRKDMPEFWYLDTDTNKKHRYFPDIYIPEENKIIEVKSEWTMQKYFWKNILKALSVKNNGYEFELMVLNK